MPIGAATGPLSGVSTPRLMVLDAASMPGAVCTEPPEAPPPLLLDELPHAATGVTATVSNAICQRALDICGLTMLCLLSLRSCGPLRCDCDLPRCQPPGHEPADSGDDTDHSTWLGDEEQDDQQTIGHRRGVAGADHAAAGAGADEPAGDLVGVVAERHRQRPDEDRPQHRAPHRADAADDDDGDELDGEDEVP